MGDKFVQQRKAMHITLYRDYCPVKPATINCPVSPFRFGRDSIRLTTPFYDKIVKTKKESSIERHRDNFFASVQIFSIVRKIESTDDTIYFSIDTHMDRRDALSTVHEYNDTQISFSFNKKTGDFIVFNGGNYFKNSFLQLWIFLEIAFRNISWRDFNVNEDGDNLLLINELNSQFGFIFLSNFWENREMDLSSIKFTHLTDVMGLFLEKFVELKKIKVPNDYKDLLAIFCPTQESLEKNEYKLIASILDDLGIKSKITIKILHTNPQIDLSVLLFLCRLFRGKYTKYLSSIDHSHFQKMKLIYDVPIESFINRFPLGGDMSSAYDAIHWELSNHEMSLLTKMINHKEFDPPTFFFILYDHLKLMKHLQEYISGLSIKTHTPYELYKEHEIFSKLDRKIKRGITVEYQFRQETIDVIEAPIEVIKDGKKIYLYPYILKREEEYIEEGEVMHHCVASYRDKTSSIIVSLRTEDKLDRATSEYHIQNGGRIQSKYFCNAKPPEYFMDAISTLSDRAYELSKWNKLGWIDQKKVPLKINGKEVDIVRNRLLNIDYDDVRDIRDIAGFLV